MTDDELAATVIPGTRGPIKERADGTLTCMLVIQLKDKSAFLKALPDIDLPVFIVPHNPRHARVMMQKDMAESGAAFGQFARQLRASVDWMGNPEVWAVVGSDTQYLDWCREQPCAHCKIEPHWENERWVGSEAAHVRRIENGAGERIKPLYSAIPLCHRCHALQHQQGESAIGGKNNVNKLRIRAVQDWVWTRMRSIFHVESMSEASPAAVRAWAQEHGIDKFLPRCYVTGTL